MVDDGGRASLALIKMMPRNLHRLNVEGRFFLAKKVVASFKGCDELDKFNKHQTNFLHFQEFKSNLYDSYINFITNSTHPLTECIYKN